MYFSIISFLFLLSSLSPGLQIYAELCVDSGDVTCDFDSNQMRCAVFNNTIQVQGSLEACSYRRQLHIHFEVNGHLNLSLDKIIASVEHAWIVASENSTISLDVQKMHLNLTFLLLAGGNFNLMPPSSFEFNKRSAENNFFNHFPNLQVLIAIGRFTFNFFPSFTSLKNLTILIVKLDRDGSRNTGFNIATSFNGSVIKGLENLGAVSWTGGRLGTITSNAFEGVSNLRTLELSDNRINLIERNAFAPLTEITKIQLNNNIIQNVIGPVFDRSIRLQILQLSNNPLFPLESLRGCHASDIYLNNNGYETLRLVDFQSLASRPVSVEMSELLSCDCSLKWTSVVRDFGITFTNAFCKEPRHELGKQIQFASYRDCNDTRLFNCGGPNKECLLGHTCLINETGAYCLCAIGFIFNSITLRCEDMDECSRVGSETVCQHICNNTEGSYICTCNQGYQISANRFGCQDTNECLLGNGGCEFACINTIGGHQCVCRNGNVVNQSEDCMETNLQTEKVSIWGLSVSITLFLLLLLVTTIVTLYIMYCCVKRYRNRASDRTVRTHVNHNWSREPSYVNRNPELNPDIEPYLIVQGDENGLNIQTNNWGEERNQNEREYYVI